MFSGEYWTYSHESNFVRLLVLLQHGGIYLDTDIVLVKSLQVSTISTLFHWVITFFQAKSFRNSIAYEMEDGGRLNNNVLIFDPNHWFLLTCLQVLVIDNINLMCPIKPEPNSGDVFQLQSKCLHSKRSTIDHSRFQLLDR